jgi:hypothetical protein
MNGNILSALTGQSVTSLSDLAKAIRAEHAAVVSALSGAVEHAIRCGPATTATAEVRADIAAAISPDLTIPDFWKREIPAAARSAATVRA